MHSELQASSQLLQRHPQLFSQSNLVIAGQILDDYALSLQAECHSIQLCCNNFVHYQALQQHRSKNFKTVFSAQPELSENSNTLLIYMPKAKQELAYLLACLLPQLPLNSDIFIVGENRSGIKSAEKRLAAHGLKAHKLDSARRCSLYHCQLDHSIAAFELSHWQQQFSLQLPQGQLQVSSLPGVFNHGKLDLGTELLLQHLPPMKGKVLDFGCGAGIIGAALALKQAIDLSQLDVNCYALASSQATLELNHLVGTVFASNGLSEVSEQFDFIVSNPPFHTGLATDYSIIEQFFTQAKQHLTASGELWIVANSHLPYEGLLQQCFTEVQTLVDTRKFKVLRAQ